MADRKLDVHALLRATDKCDGDWLSRQPEDARKEFAPVVALRWAATVKDGHEASVMLWLINERVNVHMFDLYKHPDLVFRLMAACGLGVTLNHQWLSGHRRALTHNKAYQLLADRYPDANARELDFLMSRHTKSSFSDFLGECGIQPDIAKEIMKAYDKIKD
jgi:hypothetical protein